MKQMIATGLAAFVVSAAAIAATTDQLPGRWQSTVTTVSNGKPHTNITYSCIEPGANMLAELTRQQGEGCHYSRMVASGGRIDVAGTCPGGGSTMTGTYTPTTMAFTTKGTMRIGKTVLPIDMSVKSHRVAAACSADDE